MEADLITPKIFVNKVRDQEYLVTCNEVGISNELMILRSGDPVKAAYAKVLRHLSTAIKLIQEQEPQ